MCLKPLTPFNDWVLLLRNSTNPVTPVTYFRFNMTGIISPLTDFVNRSIIYAFQCIKAV